MSRMHKGWRISRVEAPRWQGTITSSGLIGRHKGRVGLVVANGPSLGLVGPDRLFRFIEQKKPIILGYNRMWEAFGEGTRNIYCHYFGVLDASFWRKNYRKIEAWLNEHEHRPTLLLHFRPSPTQEYINLHLSEGMQAKQKPRYMPGQIFNGFNGGNAMIQVAVHMGFSDVFIIGCDCGTYEGQTHAWGTREIHPTYRQGDRFLPGFNHLPEWAEPTGVRLWNLSLISRITAIPKVDIDSLLAGNRVDQSIVEGQPLPLAMSHSEAVAARNAN